MAASYSHGVLEKDLMEEREGESFLKFQEVVEKRVKKWVKVVSCGLMTWLYDVSYLYPLD